MENKKVRIHYLQHVPFEGIGCIENWAVSKGHQLTNTQFYESESLPAPDQFDWLVVMGGPMGVSDEIEFPWLKLEKAFIKKAIDSNKKIIGICLGAQLIAEVLGAKVYRNNKKEIGWFDIQLTDNGTKHELFEQFPTTLKVFHWHDDTFKLPEGANHLFKSEACENQAFIFENRVLGLQFHFEMTEKLLNQMIGNGDDEELIEDDFVQSGDEILSIPKNRIVENNQRMFQILDWFEKKSK